MIMRMVWWCVSVIVLLVYPCVSSSSQTDIVASGQTLIRTEVDKTKVSVVIDTERVGKGAGAPIIVRAIKIAVRGKQIFVPRSVYADIVNPRTANVGAENGADVLAIGGGDGAESYTVKINFNSERVTRRRLYSSLDESAPTEDTQYRLNVLKDEY